MEKQDWLVEVIDKTIEQYHKSGELTKELALAIRKEAKQKLRDHFSRGYGKPYRGLFREEMIAIDSDLAETFKALGLEAE